MEFIKLTKSWVDRQSKYSKDMLIPSLMDDVHFVRDWHQDMRTANQKLTSYLEKHHELGFFIKGLTAGKSSGEAWDLYVEAGKLQDRITEELIKPILDFMRDQI